MIVPFKALVERERELIKSRVENREKKSWYARIPRGMWEKHLKGCSFAERSVYITLKMFENKEHKCYPSIRLVASILEASTSTVSIAVERLITKHLLLKESRRGRHNNYIIC